VTNVARWLAEHADLDRLDRDLLLAEALGIQRAQVVAYPERAFDAAQSALLQRWAERRRSGEPLAYILERKEFWSIALTVSPAVLIPRPETELLVEQALAVSGHGHGHGTRILDLGTGSGAIAIALASEIEHGEICASDVSQAALKIAAANAATHNAAVTFIASDWFANISGRFHTIVSNPPYVAAHDPHLAELQREPRNALVSGREGLDAIRYIIPAACKRLADDGWLIIEHGHDQGAAVRALMTHTGYDNLQTVRDLAGLERVTRGHWRGQL
jgi:release factor glutamine methyltransferase